MRINLPNARTFSQVFKKAIGVDIVENINGVTTDSREIQKGDLYISIKGENVDGNIFLNDVFKKGALCAIVSEKIPDSDGFQVTTEGVGYFFLKVYSAHTGILPDTNDAGLGAEFIDLNKIDEEIIEIIVSDLNEDFMVWDD